MVESDMVAGGERLRTVYFGSPEFAVPALRAVASSPAFELALVVTQAAKGESPVEREARQLGLPVYKPETLRDADSRAPLVAAQADLFIVAAFGLIFRQRTLDIPRLGAVNIHPSALPRFRGASPISAAIFAGDQTTGVSLMVMDSGIDTGAVISFEPHVVALNDTTESLGARLAEAAARQLVRDVPLWVAGGLQSRSQAASGASLTRTLTKADGWIDWTKPAAELERHVRAMWPWPRAWTLVDEIPLQVHAAHVSEDDAHGQLPGTVLVERKRLVVATGHGALEIDQVEPAGRRAMSASAYLNGRRTPISQMGNGELAPELPPLVVPID